jgi:hypothetical protein
MDMRGSPSFARRPLLAACGLLVLAFSGCQEIQGPVWSPDGTCVAYTSYVRTGLPGARMETNVYLVDPDDENGEAVLLARHAAFPRWVPEGPQGPQLYLLGHRNAEGFYTSLLVHRKLGEGALQIVLQDPNLKLVGFQLSAAIGGGLTPLIAASLASYMGGTAGVSLMLILLASITFVAALCAPETKDRSLQR